MGRYSIIIRTLVLFLIVWGMVQNAKSQSNPLIADEKSRTAPFLMDQNGIQKGEGIYFLNCNSCHGDPGKANSAKLDPVPEDPASTEFQSLTDGEMFYTITNGEGIMPAFSRILSEEQRWQVVFYMRTFNKNYKQPPIQVIKAGVATTMSIALSYDSIHNRILVSITDSVKGIPTPVPDLPVALYIKRTFGSLLMGEKKSDPQGIAQFDFPEGIPADSSGNVILIIQSGGDSRGITHETVKKIGKPARYKKLLDERTWWNINAMAPLWLIIVYSCGVSAVAITLLFVLFQLKKIRDINHKKNPGFEK